MGNLMLPDSVVVSSGGQASGFPSRIFQSYRIETEFCTHESYRGKRGMLIRRERRR